MVIPSIGPLLFSGGEPSEHDQCASAPAFVQTAPVGGFGGIEREGWDPPPWDFYIGNLPITRNIIEYLASNICLYALMYRHMHIYHMHR